MLNANRKPAALACSGCNVEDLDFRLSRIKDRDWEIVPLSKQGLLWSKANFEPNFQSADEPVIRTNLAGANAFLRRTRALGYRSEYIGPSMTTIF